MVLMRSPPGGHSQLLAMHPVFSRSIPREHELVASQRVPHLHVDCDRDVVRMTSAPAAHRAHAMTLGDSPLEAEHHAVRQEAQHVDDVALPRTVLADQRGQGSELDTYVFAQTA